MFCLVDNNFFFNRLFGVKYCFSSHEYCTPENQEKLLDNHWCQRILGKRRDALNLTSRNASGLDLAERVRGETTLLTKLLSLKNGEKIFECLLTVSMLKVRLSNCAADKTLYCGRRAFYPFSCVDGKLLFRFRT